MHTYEQAVNYIRSIAGECANIEIGLILGSGLGEVAGFMHTECVIKYADIPGFQRSTVEGHAGELAFGTVAGKRVATMRGRFHYYEGYAPSAVAFPIVVMNQLGAHTLILTNAAGGVNLCYRPGELMVISDHINMTGLSPLTGPNIDELGPRFPDMSHAYDRRLTGIAQCEATRLGVKLHTGVYAQMPGPAYETPAEIRMLRTLGADAVGMSTVPEAIMASYLGMHTLGISCITNMAAGILDKPLNHAEVVEVGLIARDGTADLLKAVIENLRNTPGFSNGD